MSPSSASYTKSTYRSPKPVFESPFGAIEEGGEGRGTRRGLFLLRYFSALSLSLSLSCLSCKSKFPSGDDKGGQLLRGKGGRQGYKSASSWPKDPPPTLTPDGRVAKA